MSRNIASPGTDKYAVQEKYPYAIVKKMKPASEDGPTCGLLLSGEGEPFCVGYSVPQVWRIAKGVLVG